MVDADNAGAVGERDAAAAAARLRHVLRGGRVADADNAGAVGGSELAAIAMGTAAAGIPWEVLWMARLCGVLPLEAKSRVATRILEAAIARATRCARGSLEIEGTAAAGRRRFGSGASTESSETDGARRLAPTPDIAMNAEERLAHRLADAGRRPRLLAVGQAAQFFGNFWQPTSA